MARASVAPGHVTSTLIVSPSWTNNELSFVYPSRKKGLYFIELDLDLIAGGLVSLSVGTSLSSAVAPNHILIELLGDIQICHTNQVTAVLRAETKEKKTVRQEPHWEAIVWLYIQIHFGQGAHFFFTRLFLYKTVETS